MMSLGFIPNHQSSNFYFWPHTGGSGYWPLQTGRLYHKFLVVVFSQVRL